MSAFSTTFTSPSLTSLTGITDTTTAPVLALTNTGLAVTGTLSATGDITQTVASGGINIGPSGATASIKYNADGGFDITPRAGYGTRVTAGGLAVAGTLSATNAASWVGAHIGGSGGADRAVIGNLSARTTYGAHNEALNAWAPVAVSGSTVELQISGTTAATLSSTGLAVTGNLSSTGTIETGGYTVATLPSGTVGQRAYVTDATTPTYNAALTGGGAVRIPVFKNATVWVSA